MNTSHQDNSTQSQRLFDIPFVLTVITVSILGAIIGMQLITTLGVTPNTSIIGVLVAVILSKIPLGIFYRLRSQQGQVTVQTAISAATFGAANSLFIPLGIPYVMGRPDLMVPMLIGVGFALLIDGFMIYRVFDSKVFPASGAWPPGVAAAETIKAVDSGGKQAGILGAGILTGIVGAVVNIPMSAAGIAFIANIFAMIAFATGLVVSGYAPDVAGIDLNELYIAHGVMIGAGLVALIQFVVILIKQRRENLQQNKTQSELRESDGNQEERYTRSSGEVGRTFAFGYVAYALVAVIIALLGGLMADLSLGMLALFVVFAAFSALATEIIVGIAAMHSGWFPAFAVSLISLVIGMLIGFPPVTLALLVGFTAATGPAFADLGYDLRAGFIVRGHVKTAAEVQGRKQQFKATLIGFGVAIAMVSVFHSTYFDLGLIPPIDFVYVSTIEAGTSDELLTQLAIWSLLGAIVQILGGPRKQLGVLFATGLLVADPITGLTVFGAIIVRAILIRWRGEGIRVTLYTLGAGFIAGGAVYDFFSSVVRAR